MIPYAKHCVDESDIRAVAAALRSSRLTQGGLVPAFEEALAVYLGAKHVIAVSSGTAALCATLQALGQGMKGRAVITTPLTFLATATSILHAGLRPVFVDIDPETMLLDAREAEKAARELKVAAILPVDFTGRPVPPMDYSTVIYDAAHSLGAPGVAKRGLATCFSFHAAKLITTGEGGAVATDDPLVAESCRRFRDHGRGPDGLSRQAGWNYRMTEIQAALGISQLSRIDTLLARRREIAKAYSGALPKGKMRLPCPHPGFAAVHLEAWHLFVVRVCAQRRAAFRHALLERGIGTQIHYVLAYDHPILSTYRSDCPNAETASREVVSLPMHPGMSDDEVGIVIDGVLRATKEAL